MTTPETIHDLCAHPDARLQLDAPVPNGFIDAAEATTLYTLGGTIQAADIDAHRFGLAENSWLFDAAGVLTRAEVLGLREMAGQRRAVQLGVFATDQARRQAAEKEAYQIAKVGKMLAKQPEPIRPVAQRLMAAYWGVDTDMYVATPGLIDKQVMFHEEFRDTQPSRKQIFFGRHSYQEAADVFTQMIRVDAERIIAKDVSVFNALSASIVDMRQIRQRQGSDYSHGTLFLPWQQAAVVYGLQAAGLPAEHITPSPVQLCQDDSGDMAAGRVQAEAARRPFTSIAPDPIARSVIKQRLDLPVTEADIAQSLLQARSIDMVQKFADLKLNLTANKYHQLLAEVLACIDPDEIKDYYAQTQAMPHTAHAQTTNLILTGFDRYKRLVRASDAAQKEAAK